MKRNIGKCVTNLVLISIILFSNSCNRYNIVWRNYSQYDDTRVVFTTQDSEEVRIVLNKSYSFYTFSSIEYVNFQQPKECYLYIYPFFDKSIKSELFFYDIQILYHEKTVVKIAPRQGVEAYYADFYIDGLRFTVISKDNEIAITEPQEIKIKDTDTILFDLGTTDCTYVYTGRNDYNGTVVCGYIVRSKIDNTLHWLGP